ncbi:MAG: sigma-70 family RNA polymerase sigma factor, partial [Gemmatimonadales bacterium]
RVLADPLPSPDRAAATGETRRRVRAALDRLPERERRLLLLRAEGYSYRDIALALELNQTSVGTLLLRARQAFRETYSGEGGDRSDAP